MSYKKLKELTLKINSKNIPFKKVLSLKTFVMPNNKKEVFYIDKSSDFCQIFAITTDNEVITVLQWRPGPEKILCEMPGGKKEDNETHLEAAKRELKEETSYVGEMTYLGSFPSNPYSETKKHMYMASNCVKANEELDLDENEFLMVKLIPLKTFRRLLANAKIGNGTDVAYLALNRLEKV